MPASAAEICSALGVESVLVSEGELADGFRFAYARAKLACEVAGAATIAALLGGRVPLEAGETVLAVVSGGNIAPKPPLLFWPHDEGRRPSRVRSRDGALRVRQHVSDAFDESRPPR